MIALNIILDTTIVLQYFACMCQLTWMIVACKSKDIMVAFKKEILTRFIGTDEGEVTEDLGCELIRDRSAKSATALDCSKGIR